MAMRGMARTLLLGTALATGACGVTYHSPSVRQQAQGAEVRVIELTAQSVLMANREPYTPRSLPEAFSQVVYPNAPRGIGAVPTAPEYKQNQLVGLETRLPPAVTAEPYRIGVGDVLLLATKSAANTVEQLTGLLAAQNQRQGYTVRDDGAIAIPDIGAVMLAGMTLDEAEAKLFQVLVENQIDPAFSLEVSEFNSRRVSVGGAVRNPSVVPITLKPLNLSEALAAVGGVTSKDREYASIRLYRDGTLYQIPMTTFVTRPELGNLLLLDGDALFVDTSYDLDRAMEFYTQSLRALELRRNARYTAMQELQVEMTLRQSSLREARDNFRARQDLGGEKRDYVYLTGEVKQQSRFIMPYDQQVTLADVLYDKGGFNTATGNPAQIYVLRASTAPEEFGAVTAWHLDARNAVNITLATRMEMRPNDIIFIEEQPVTKWGRAIQQVFPTLLGTASSAAN
ncbi:polysaccharide biosynthesis/export family protein [Thalassovita sp.]|uniref:polysaccharide biosynthesis/export family protein n=1 Tax=Thalassovita sp. TaxID=1979401 RepID=UPI0029DE8559|nr:polysaccharide biosynthesis/export family protein [Thalassovita sp.]